MSPITALVNIEIYSIIEQTKMDEILKAQSYSLSGCTDDACAIEVGEMLSAEQIILGNLTKVGSKYLLTAKLIDVETGEQLKADDVQSESIEKMLEQARALAYSISGLAFQYQPKTEDNVSFGEIYITTNPEGADIFINGKKAGASPYLFSNIPVGKAVIEARKGNYYLSEEIQITGKLIEHSMVLNEMTGSMFIESSENHMYIYLDDSEFGRLGNGLHSGITIGTHKLELINTISGYYWQGSITIEPNITTRLRIEPFAVGSLEYRLPTGITARLTGNHFDEELSESGKLNFIPAGKYSIVATGENYKNFEDEIVIHQNETDFFSPTLEYSEEYKKSLKFAEWSREIQQFKRWIDDPTAFSKIIVEDDKIALTRLHSEIEASKYKDDELLMKIEELYTDYDKEIKKNKISYLSDKLDELQAEKSSIDNKNNAIDIVSWSSIGVGAASVALFITGIFIAELAYDDYEESVYSDDLVTARETVQTWEDINLISGITAGATAAIGITTAFINIDSTDVEAQIAETSMELAKLNGGINSK